MEELEEGISHRTVKVNGINMHIAEKGHGAPVLLIHGFPELWYAWRHQIAGLAVRGYRALAPDLRGFGDTDAPTPTPSTNAYSVHHIVGDLIALMDALELDQVYVVGHDWGAIVAWYLCEFRGDRVKGLVALSVAFRPRNPAMRPLPTLRALYGDDCYICRFQMATADEKDRLVVVHAKWSYTDEKILVGLMVDQVKKGNRPTTTFSHKAWQEIVDEFYKKTGNKYERQQFKTKFNKMRRVYREFKKLRDIPTEFGWDPITKTVTAPDDVWDDYIKINKEAKQFRTKGCPLFDELDIIYGDTTARGQHAGASTQGAAETDDENEGAPLGNQNSSDPDIVVDLDDDADFMDVTNIRAQSRPPSRKRVKKGTSSFDQACASLTKYYENKVTNENNKTEDNDNYSIQNCVALLSTMPNVSSEVYLKAFHVIGSNRSWRVLFISAPEDIRPFMLDLSDLERY